jgi:hypothetical protein
MGESVGVSKNSERRGPHRVVQATMCEGMAVTRVKAEEYRRRAQECLDFAPKISLERERTIILDMAQSWLRLAEQQETQEEEIMPPPAVEQPQAAVQQQQQTQPKGEDKNKKE